MAVAEALYGAHRIPIGDVGVVAFVSVNRDEAAQRLRTIKSILDVLEVPYKPITDGVELVERRVVFKTFAASIGSVSGFTSICILCDELSKWVDSDTGKNPATEVLASIRPTMATQRKAKIFLSSSPMGNLDAHAKAYNEGDTAGQMVAFATTWEANPTVTKAMTQIDEPDEARWAREYAGIPLEDAESGVLTSVQLDRVTRSAPEEYPYEDGHTYVCAMDPATRGNAWTMVVATRRRDTTGAVKQSLVLAKEWKGTRSNPLDPDKVLAEIAGILESYGVTTIVSDQYSGDALASIARRYGLWILIEPQTAGSKLKMFGELATKIANKEIDLCPNKVVRADLLAVKQRLSATGMSIVYSDTSDGRHSDYAPSVATCMCALDRFGMDPPLIGPAINSPEWHKWKAQEMKEQRRAYQAQDYQRRMGPYWKVHPSDRIKKAN